MKKILSIVICSFAVLFQTQANAQEQSKHEVSVHGGVGLSTLNYSLEVGDRNGKVAPNFGLGYNYFISDKFSVGTGVELAFYNAVAKVKNMQHSNYALDSENKGFQFVSELKGYEEKQKSMYINIPITAQFQTKLFSEHKFYAVLGGKFGLPLKSKFETSSASLSTKGLYIYSGSSNPIIIDNVPSEGFGQFEGVGAKGDVDFNPVVMVTSEVGIKWKISSTTLYTGINFDYGLNDVIKGDKDKKLIAYNKKSPENFEYNSVLNSKNYVSKAVPMFLGIKVKLAFDPERWFKNNR